MSDTPYRTPTRGIRIPDEEWVAFQTATATNGETASAIARRLFREYVRDNAPDMYEQLRMLTTKRVEQKRARP